MPFKKADQVALGPLGQRSYTKLFFLLFINVYDDQLVLSDTLMEILILILNISSYTSKNNVYIFM